MDKYVVKLSSSSNLQHRPSSSRTFRQSKLGSLKGVISFSQFGKIKTIIESNYDQEDVIIQALEDLRRKRPNKELLLKTGMGKFIKKLTRHENANIAKSALEIYHDWKAHILQIHSLEKIEVSYDQSMLDVRKRSIRLFSGALKSSDETIANEIETYVFNSSEKLLNTRYRKNIQRLVLMLQNNEDLRSKMNERVISPQELQECYECTQSQYDWNE